MTAPGERALDGVHRTAAGTCAAVIPACELVHQVTEASLWPPLTQHAPEDPDQRDQGDERTRPTSGLVAMAVLGGPRGGLDRSSGCRAWAAPEVPRGGVEWTVLIR